VSVPSRVPPAKDDAKGYLVLPMPPTPFGKYTIIGKLGHGGMAEVNLAVVGGKGGFRKLFVVKRLHAHLEVEPGFVDMFLDEARLAAQLDHPNCVQTVEVGEAEGHGPPGHAAQHFLAMEYLDGQGLERLLRITGQRGDILPIHTSVRMIADALDGLGYAHDLRGYDGTPLGVVHRDVSPQNIFVTYAGVVKLLDFGIAKAESNVVETRTGVVKGKYAYIAPEQALAAPVDKRADLWSMGVVLWEMLTSRRLFKSVNELATLNETLRGEIHAPSKYNPAIPPELDAIVLGALQREVDKRYRSAHEFKDALESWLATQPEPSDRKAIAALMKERFGDILEQHKQRLKECIASVAEDPRSLDRLVLGGAHSTSTSMEGDALQSGSHPPVPVVGSGARPVPAAGHSMTPTPSPRPRLGLSVSGSITSGMPSMDEIAPRVSHTPPPFTPPPGYHTPSSSGQVVLTQGSQSLAMGPPSTSSHPGHPSSSSEWSAQSNPSFAAPPSGGHSGAHGAPSAGISGAFGTDQTIRVPQRRSRSRSIAWWLIGLAACVVSAVVAIVMWTAMHGGGPELVDGSSVSMGATGTVLPPVTPTTSEGVPPATTASPTPPTPPATAVPPTTTSLELAPSATTDVATTSDRTDRNPRRTTRSDRNPGRDQETPTTTVETTTPPPQVETTPPPPDPTPHGPGFLSLVTSPWTQVTLDGRSLGETPLVRVSLPPGNHTLRLRNTEAGIDETYEVTIRSGETLSRRLGLR
jgi:serine/threonine-protein kinase